VSASSVQLAHPDGSTLPRRRLEICGAVRHTRIVHSADLFRCLTLRHLREGHGHCIACGELLELIERDDLSSF
jgi:hypothetical protein